jgi:hypothetical protein
MKAEEYIIKTHPLTDPTLLELEKTWERLPETPCDNCWHTHKYCQNREIACKDFAYYILSGKVRNKWREPNTEIFFEINPKLKRHEMSEELATIEEEPNFTPVYVARKEKELLEKLRIKSLEGIDKYFNDKGTLEKAKIGCIVYSLVLKADSAKGTE